MVIRPLVKNLIVLTQQGITEEDIQKLDSAAPGFEYTRQSGKTTTVVHICETVMLFVSRLFDVPIEIGIFAPQKEQANTDFKRLKNALQRSKQDLQIIDHDANKKAKEESNAKTIVLGNGSSCYIFPVTPTSKPESKTLHLIIIEEAQDINDTIVNEDIMPMGASTNAVVVKVGTAGNRKGRFYKEVQKGKVYVMRFPEIAADRRRLYEKTGDARHLVYEQHVNALIDKHGIDSPEIQKPYFNVWQLSAGMFIESDQLLAGRIVRNFEDPKADTLFTEYRQWLSSGRRELSDKDKWAEEHKLSDERYEMFRTWTEANHYFGLDTAKSNDQTVLKIGRLIDDRLTVVRSVQGLKGVNYQDQFDVLKKELEPFKIAAGAIDSTGQGDFMPDLFERQTSYKLIRVTFSRLSKDVMYKSLYQKMVNDRFAYYFQDIDEYPLRGAGITQAMTPEQYTAHASSEFEDEFIDLEKRYIGNIMVVHHPEKTDDGEQPHDDHPDATALMNRAFDVYNENSGILDYYTEQTNAEERAGNVSAIAEANKGQ